MTLYVCVLPVGDHWQIVEAIREENGGHSVERILPARPQFMRSGTVPLPASGRCVRVDEVG